MTNIAGYKAALEWYIDNGVDEALIDEPYKKEKSSSQIDAASYKILTGSSAEKPAIPQASVVTFLGKSDARAASEKLAQGAANLDELREAIAAFDGIALKKTATNMVFCDGNPNSPVMLVGEAPGADEDRLGKPFVGVSGQLLDKIFACIDINRHDEDPSKAVYISNILNWRPPGNRTPSPAEVEVSLPFIEKHIVLVKPKLLILCGGVSAKALLNTDLSISRLRGKWHDYKPSSAFLKDHPPIPALCTYHPAYLLRTPSQKKAVWQDMLTIQSKLLELGQES